MERDGCFGCDDSRHIKTSLIEVLNHVTHGGFKTVSKPKLGDFFLSLNPKFVVMNLLCYIIEYYIII